ncbi:MAG: (Fe-S)-binding protein [Rubrobacteraceae bacterium]
MNAPDHSTLGEPARSLLEGEYSNMLSCIRCGLCLTSCPTYVLSGHEAEGPRGRVAMARAFVEGKTDLTPDLIVHEQNCLVCDACTAVCPAGVSMDPIQVALRTAMEPHLNAERPAHLRGLRRMVFRKLFADMRLFRFLVRSLGLYQRTGLQWLARRSGTLKLLRLDEPEALLPPKLPGRFVVPRGKRHPAQRSGTEERSVGLFAGCVMSTAMADVDRATVRVCRKAGWTVSETAGQGCCGALNAHGGDLEGMKTLAKRNIAAFEDEGDSSVVVNSAGCGAMLKDYAHHFRDDEEWAERAKAFSGRVRDVTELVEPGDLEFKRKVERTVTYQEPCHLVHAQRISEQPRALLKAIPGLELREMEESSLCCGSAGVYNVTNPEESSRLQERKLDNAAATGAGTIVTANPGCHMQLAGGLRNRGEATEVKHIVELLDEGTGGVEEWRSREGQRIAILPSTSPEASHEKQGEPHADF